MLGGLPIAGLVSALSRNTRSSTRLLHNYSRCQHYAQQAGRVGARQAAKSEQKMRSLKETLMAPAGQTAFTLGRGVLVGSSALGLGALCYYGMGLSNQIGAIDRAVFWPQVVKDRVRDTYLYFGGGLIFTAGTAVAVARNPAMMNMMMKNSWLAIGATFAAMIGTGMVARSIPYKEGFGTKQLAWMAHAAVMGAVVAPITLLGGPILTRAAIYTAGIIGGLSTVAVCAPSEKFLYMGGPLAIGFGVVLAASIGKQALLTKLPTRLLQGNCTAHHYCHYANTSRLSSPRNAMKSTMNGINCIFPRQYSITLPANSASVLSGCQVEPKRLYSTNQETREIKHIYKGMLTTRLYIFKAFSLTTSILGIGLNIYLYPQLHLLDPVSKFLIGSMAGFFIYLNPVLMNLLTRRYVTAMTYDPNTEKFTTTTVSFFLRKKTLTFHRDEVTVPELAGAFTSIFVNKIPLLIDFESVTDKELLHKLLSYDIPMKWFHDDVESKK